MGCLNIVKSSTIFPVFNGLLTAQVFRKYAYNIISSNTFMPGLYIRKRTMILPLLKKKLETGLVYTCKCGGEPATYREVNYYGSPVGTSNFLTSNFVTSYFELHHFLLLTLSLLSSNFLLPTSNFLLLRSYFRLLTSDFQLPTSNFLLSTFYF